MRTITCNNFTQKIPTVTFNVLGVIKNSKTLLVKDTTWGQLYHIDGIGENELTISKVGYIGLVKVSNFIIS